MSRSSCTLLGHTWTDSASNTIRHLPREYTSALRQDKCQGHRWMIVSVWNIYQYSSGLSLRHGVLPAHYPHNIRCNCIIRLEGGRWINLHVNTGDVINAYMTAPCSEKIWNFPGKEFGADQGKKAIIVRALYGLKSYGASFHAHLSECMRSIGYTTCRGDNDLWMKHNIDPDREE